MSRDRTSDGLIAHPVQAEVDYKVFVVFHEFVCVGRDVLVLWWTSEDSPDSGQPSEPYSDDDRAVSSV